MSHHRAVPSITEYEIINPMSRVLLKIQKYKMTRRDYPIPTNVLSFASSDQAVSLSSLALYSLASAIPKKHPKGCVAKNTAKKEKHLGGRR